MSDIGKTFVVTILYEQNHTWQGTVEWVERKKKIPFRSALELIKLMESATDLDIEKKSKKQ